MGANARIYVIKYRTTATTAADDCASGTAAPYLQKVSGEADLKAALAAIANDIKIFANYRDAHVQ
jgi:hypothetical protein